MEENPKALKLQGRIVRGQVGGHKVNETALNELERRNVVVAQKLRQAPQLLLVG